MAKGMNTPNHARENGTAGKAAWQDVLAYWCERGGRVNEQ
jgi:hypothetical protein